jgi:hypothetical protein
MCWHTRQAGLDAATFTTPPYTVVFEGALVNIRVGAIVPLSFPDLLAVRPAIPRLDFLVLRIRMQTFHGKRVDSLFIPVVVVALPLSDVVAVLLPIPPLTLPRPITMVLVPLTRTLYRTLPRSLVLARPLPVLAFGNSPPFKSLLVVFRVELTMPFAVTVTLHLDLLRIRLSPLTLTLSYPVGILLPIPSLLRATTRQAVDVALVA